MRKIVVGSLALCVLAGVFLLYLRFNRTPPIVVKAAESSPRPAADANSSDSEGPAGTILDVGIGHVRQTKFQHRNEFNRPDREFGFEELLHEQGNQWQISKPYMKLYVEKFACRVTADRGRVQISDVARQPMPTDAEFIGNVVIHIVPNDPNDPWECFIHLDDVGFLAEKSLFSSSGPIQFLSRAMRLTGTGMELLYDAPRSRLDLFRVFDLDSLRLRSSEIQSLANSDAEDVGKADAAIGKDSGIASVAAGAGQEPAPADSNAPPAEVYRCVFRKNVRLDSPEGVVVAWDELAINNIRLPRDTGPEPKAEQAADPNEQAPAAPPSSDVLNTMASSHPAMSSIPEELYDIVVTCDGGAEIVLANGPNQGVASTVPAAQGQEAVSSKSVPGVVAAPDAMKSPPAEKIPEEIASSDRQQTMARRIDFDFSSQDTSMLGPVAMKFFVDPNVFGEKAGGKPMPMVVTAQKAVRFRAASEQIVLEGDATATLYRSEPNSSDEVRLAAPRLTLDLAIDANVPDKIKVDLRRLVADGIQESADPDQVAAPPVAVRLWRRTVDKLLGWVALDVQQLQYDTDSGLFTAVGPGSLWLHNATAIQSKTDPNDVFKPCYARLSNFDALTYGTLSKRIVAEDDLQQLLLDYFPFVDGKPGPQTEVVAGHIEAAFEEVVKGRMELVSLVASKGIEYDNEAEHSSFIGSELVYDRSLPRITIRGDAVQPCRFNGLLVDEIVIDPKTGHAEAQFPTTSVFQIRQ